MKIPAIKLRTAYQLTELDHQANATFCDDRPESLHHEAAVEKLEV